MARGDGAAAGTAAGWRFFLLWLAGIDLRLTILAVPPVLPLIHRDLGLDETSVAALTGLPVLLFALVAVPGSLLIARLGARRALIAGLVTVAFASAGRGLGASAPMLFAMTFVMGAGVATMQPALPALVSHWLQSRAALATAVYANGLLVGEVLAAGLTIPLVLPLVGGSWRLAFMVWALPCIVIALALADFAPRGERGGGPTVPRRWWPDWRSGLIWRLGLMFGANNATYFTINGFIPDYLHHIGRPELIGVALSALNIGQLPASLILLAGASRLIGRPWPYAACGVLSIACVLGIVFGSGPVIVVAAAALGFSGATTLTLLLAMPALLSDPDDVHRTTAAMFTISYSCAVVVPIVSGALWDASAVPAAAFVPIALGNLLLIALPWGIRRHAEQSGSPMIARS